MGVLERRLREETILNAAAEVFCSLGFGDTNMVHIAKKAKLSKGLLYFYYQSKDYLYMAVILHAIKRTIEFQKEVLDGNRQKNGLNRLMELLDAYFIFIREHPFYQDAISNFINMSNPIKGRKSKTGLTKGMKESPFYTQLMALKFEPFKLITEALVQGKQDGSIKTNLPPAYLYLSIWSLMIGYEKLSIKQPEGENLMDTPYFIFDEKSWQETIRNIVRTILTTEVNEGIKG